MDRAAERVLEASAAAPAALVCVVGPTASGKTELAVRVAERLGGEIVSADSVQVYRRFDVGSGKPTAEELARAPHHLISILDPRDAIDAARWAARADRALEDIRARGRVPVVCGGTFLWVKALVQGLVAAPPASEPLREAHRARVEKEGRAALHAELAKVDPASAARLHPNDVVRVSRALEVVQLTGQRLSDLHAAHGFARARHEALLFAPRREPAELTARIAARVDAFLAAGWEQEVRALLDDGLRDARAMGSVGYKEVAACVRGDLPRAELRDTIVRATRVFARRQTTWLRSAKVEWLV